MKTKCPACGAVFSLDVLINHEGAREAVLTALQFPAPIGKLLIQYLGLFRPAARDLSFERVNTILSELLPAVRDNRFERNGRAWIVPKECWSEAIQQMLALRDAGKLQLPLKSHGYLLEILVSMVNKAEAKAETRTEQIRQSGGYSARQGGGLQALTAVSEAMISHRQGGPPDSDACQRVSGSQASPSSKPVKREIPAHARKALGLDKPKSEVETDGSNE